MVKTRPLVFTCPACGSGEVFYSCTPNCCMNHVCAACGASFEPATEAVGAKLSGIAAPDPPPDSTGPTAACARCESVSVYLLEDGRLVCGNCGEVLTLSFEGY